MTALRLLSLRLVREVRQRLRRRRIFELLILRLGITERPAGRMVCPATRRGSTGGRAAS